MSENKFTSSLSAVHDIVSQSAYWPSKWTCVHQPQHWMIVTILGIYFIASFNKLGQFRIMLYKPRGYLNWFSHDTILTIKCRCKLFLSPNGWFVLCSYLICYLYNIFNRLRIGIMYWLQNLAIIDIIRNHRYIVAIEFAYILFATLGSQKFNQW